MTPARRTRTTVRSASRKLRALMEAVEPRQLLSATLYVDAAAPGPTHDGAAWTSAFNDLQAALSAAASGDTIRVAHGTYTPATGAARTASFAVKQNVAIYGSYAGYGTADPNARDARATPTILSGDIGVRGSAADNSYHVLSFSGGSAGATVLDGLTVRDGNADSPNAAYDGNGKGAGLYVGEYSGGLLINNCTFTADAATQSGGAIYAGGSITATACTFTGDSAATGAAVAFDFFASSVVSGSTFTANAAASGGAVSTYFSSKTAIAGCTFSANTATSAGGAAWFGGNSATVTDCVFTNNKAHNGGAVADGTGIASVLDSCLFTGNSATAGGAVYGSFARTQVRNCTIAGNTANNGPAVYNSQGSPTITNSILWSNSSAAPIYNSYGTAAATSSDIQGGYAGVNNINADPLFTAYPSDLSLQPTSPCVDRGSNAGVSTTAADLAGNPRLTDVLTVANSPVGWVDMGAYECTYAPVTVDFAATTARAFEDAGTVTAYVQLTSYASAPITVPLSVTGGTADPSDYTLPPSITIPAGQSLVALSVVTLSDDAKVEPVETLQITLGTPDSGAALGAATTLTLSIVDNDLMYVDPRATAGTHEGTDWADAFTDLQAALAHASPGSSLRVATGSYSTTSTGDYTISFVMKPGVAVYGGYAGLTAAANPDVRDPDLYRSTLSGGYHVLVASGTDRTAVLDGFTVTGGKAASSRAGEDSFRVGGGVYLSNASPTFANCTFTANSATEGGGAVFASASSPAFLGCTFAGNTTDFGGGGAIDCTNGSDPAVSNCTFRSNSAVMGGGAISADADSVPAITACQFFGNTSPSSGGAVAGTTAFTVANSLFVANHAANGGALALGAGKAVNCTFVANSATTFGGALYTLSGSPSAANCLFRGNLAVTGMQTYSPSAGAITISYSDVEGGAPGTGNFDADPLFDRTPSPGPDGQWLTADDDFGDLRLSPDSPCVDAGSDPDLPADAATTDLAGGPRLIDSPAVPDAGVGPAPVVDVGAYESTPALAAHAGGPYTVLAGGTLSLHGLGASDAPGDLRFDWEWSGDNKFDDATGRNVAFPVAAYPPGTTLSLLLRITDAQGRSFTSAPTTMRIAPTIAYVDPRAAGSANGTSWVNAFPSLADALASAVPGQIVRVATGTYRPTSTGDRTVSFPLSSGVAIYGGYAGLTKPAGPDARDLALYPSTLSGDIGAVGDASDNSYHVLYATHADATAILDGFTVTAGNANTNSQTGQPDNCGAAVYAYASSPTIANCTFTANSSTRFGGALYLDHSSPAVSDSVFSDNSTGFDGAAAYALFGSPAFTRCTFTRNTNANTLYLDFSTPTFTGCSFTANASIPIYLFNSPATTITNSTFTANSGSGIYVFDNSVPYAPDPLIANCTFVGNSSGYGGGIYAWTPATVVNCTFVANSASFYGGGFYAYSGPSTLVNCIFWGNAATYSGPQITYNPTGSAAPTIIACDVQDGFGSSLTADPLFVRAPSPGPDGQWRTADDDYGDLRLQSGSPLVDAGNTAALPSSVTTDLAGNPRVQGPVVDLGAYESPGTSAAPPSATFSVPPTTSEASATTQVSLTNPTGTGPYTYSYDLDDDGTFEIANTTAASITIPASYLGDGPTLHAVRGRITGPGGFTDYEATISITDVPPTATFTNSGPVASGGAATVSFTNATDPSPADTAAGFRYSYDFNDDGTFEITNTTAASVTIPAADFPTTSGTFTVRGRVADKDGGYTDYTTAVTVTPGTTGTPQKLSGTPFGTPGSYGNQGNTYAKALDADLSTFFDAPQASGDYLGLDLAAATTISSIRFAPRGGFANRMVGGRFQGSNTSPTAGFVDLYTITAAPAQGAYTTATITDPAAYRYVRYLAPDNGWGNVAEVEFYGGSSPGGGTADPVVRGSAYGTPGSYANLGNTFDKALDSNPATYFDAPSANGDYVGYDLGAPTVITSVTFTPRSGFANRMVGGRFQGSNTSPTAGFTDLYTITATPASAATDATVTDPTPYRYVRYLAPDNGWGNVAEVAFHGHSPSGTLTPPAGPTKLAARPGSTAPNVFLTWTDNADNETGFKVERSSDNGATFTQIAVLSANSTRYLDTTAGDAVYVYRVRATNAAGDSPYSNTATFDNRTGTGNPVKLTGTVFGTAGSYGNQGNTIAKVFDGSFSTYFDAPAASGDYMGLDLGSAQVIGTIKFAPRPGYGQRMVGGVFQGSNTSPTAGFTDLYTVTSAPAANVFSTAAVTDPTAYRWIRYLAPDGSWGNVAEIEFDGPGATNNPPPPPSQLTGTPFGTAGSYGNQGNTLAKVFDGDPTTYFDAPQANGDSVGLDLGSAHTITSITFAPRPNQAARMVGGRFQASNSLTGPFTDLFTITAAPTGTYTTVQITDPTAYRYVRYLAPDGSWGNIAELEFFGM